MISTRKLDLPDIDRLRRLLQSIAMLDAILEPEWEYRYYSFNARWGRGEQMGSMRDGCGDDFFALFNRSGCWLKGFAHEAPMSPFRRTPPKLFPGVVDQVPREFAGCLKEPAFVLEATTFCIWRRCTDDAWQRGKIRFPHSADPDGSAVLLSPLDGNPQTYRTWAEDYYERSISLSAIEHVYAHRRLTKRVVAELNPDLSLDDLQADRKEIGYPAQAGW
jgi:hypothetical protein